MFYSEFSEYLESVVLNTDPVLIVGDFNIHVDCDDNTYSVKLLELFESVGLDQHVHTPTHCSGHTLDLIVTRQTDQIIASSPRADCLFSDHMPVFCHLQLDRVPRINSKVSYRNVAAINLDTLRKDLSNSILCENMESFDLNELVNCYNKTLNSILDQYAPLKTKTVTKRPIVPWFNEQVKAAKRQRRKAEKKWRRTNLNSDLADYKVQKNQTTFVMNCARKAFYTDFISQNSINQRKLFQAAKILFTRRPDLMFPDPDVLANDIGEFFVQKIERIHAEFDSSALETNHSSVPEFTELTSRFDSFDILNEENVKDLISKSSKKSCSLDPMPTSLVLKCQDILLPVITRMINLSLQSGVFCDEWKQALVQPQLKKSKTETVLSSPYQ